MARPEIQGPGGPGVRWHPSSTSAWVADYLTGTSPRPPRAIEDPLDWTFRGRRLQARAVGDGFVRLGHGLGALLSVAWKTVSRPYREHEAIRQLDRLDDHMLRDIGIRRSEIPLVVRGHATARGPGRTKSLEHPSAANGPREEDQDRLAA